MEQEFLDGLSGSVILLTPVRGPGGKAEDYRIDAASPEALDIAGRTGKELVGLRVLEAYPTVLGTELWDGYRSALETGTIWTGAPFEYEEIVAGIPRLSRFQVRAAPWGGRLVVSWERLDPWEREQRRNTLMQRLGNLGWADWDLATDTIIWSEQVYAIFGRDPGEGPMALEELPRHVPPEDLPALGANVRRLLGDGLPSTTPSASSHRLVRATYESSRRPSVTPRATRSRSTASSRTSPPPSTSNTNSSSGSSPQRPTAASSTPNATSRPACGTLCCPCRSSHCAWPASKSTSPTSPPTKA